MRGTAAPTILAARPALAARLRLAMRPALAARLALAVPLALAALLSGCSVAGVGGGAPGAFTATPSAGPLAAQPSTPSASAFPTDVDAGGAPVPSPVTVPRSDASLGAVATAATVPPVRVVVPDLGIDVSVAAEGVDGAGALALPEDPDVASWYRWGPSPWSPAGATVIASHVDSLEYGLGPFARLTDAPAGTRIEVTAEDGRVAAFLVQTVEIVEKTGVDWSRVFDRAGAPRLVLVTCGGEFDYGTGHYISNVIVTAAPAA